MQMHMHMQRGGGWKEATERSNASSVGAEPWERNVLCISGTAISNSPGFGGARQTESTTRLSHSAGPHIET